MNDSNEYTYNPFDPSSFLKEFRDANLDAWAKSMISLVHTEAYAEATARMLDVYLTTSGPFRKAIESSMTQTLAELNLPSRRDVMRIAERLTNIEMRLDDLEVAVDEALPKKRRPAKPPEKK